MGDRPIRGEEALGMPGGFKPLHAPLALAGGLVGILRAVVEVAVLAVLDARQHLPFCCTIAFQPIGDDDPWDVVAAFEELAEEFLRRLLVTSALHQDIEHVAVLIHRPPEVMPLTLDRQEDLIQMLLIPGLRPAVAQLIGIVLAELPAPLADRFIGHDDATGEQQLFDIPVTEAEAEIKPHRVADDFRWKPVVLVGRR